MKTIRSRDNAFVKRLVALAHQSRARKKEGKSVLDGAHLVHAYLDALVESKGFIDSIAIAESALEGADAQRILDAIQSHASRERITINVLQDNLMVDASSLDSPATIMAIVETPAPRATKLDASAVLVLDNVQDPGNVGSILRSAAAAGVTEVVAGAGTAFVWSPKVLRAAQGAHFMLNIVEGADVLAFVSEYKGHKGHVLALAPAIGDAISLYALPQKSLKKPTAFLLGNEGQGLSAELVRAASERVFIPMPGKVESLNVAACAAIALFEMVRQRSAS
jgi:RNA methyltransferase, TrmH family